MPFSRQYPIQAPVKSIGQQDQHFYGCRFLLYQCDFPEPDYEEINAKMKDVS
jgi:hypothetical protein